MSKNILSEIEELLSKQVITDDTANSIRRYYQSKPSNKQNRIIIVFGIIGALLVGLGIVLIIAHNWDTLPKSVKIILAFIPLVISQIFCAYVLLKKTDSITWRESISTLLFFSLAVCISLISQIYNIQGDMSSFLLTWMLLFLPMIYIMRSSMASLLYIVGITNYLTSALSESNFNDSLFTIELLYYWLLLAAALPFYFQLLLKKPESNFTLFHNWVIPISLIISVVGFANQNTELLLLTYMMLFGLLYLIGSFNIFQRIKAIGNGYKILGSTGTIVILLIGSFRFYWDELNQNYADVSKFGEAPQFYAILIFLICLIALIILLHQRKLLPSPPVLEMIYPAFFIVFLIGLASPITAMILINFITIIVAVFYILKGINDVHLGILNYGLVVLSALIICRFFDSNLNFVIRGVLFVLLGIGFFVANYTILKKRRTDENK